MFVRWLLTACVSYENTPFVYWLSGERRWAKNDDEKWKSMHCCCATTKISNFIFSFDIFSFLFLCTVYAVRRTTFRSFSSSGVAIAKVIEIRQMWRAQNRRQRASKQNRLCKASKTKTETVIGMILQNITEIAAPASSAPSLALSVQYMLVCTMYIRRDAYDSHQSNVLRAFWLFGSCHTHIDRDRRQRCHICGSFEILYVHYVRASVCFEFIKR